MGNGLIVNVSELLGKTLTNIEKGGDEIVFTDADGQRYKMYHDQDCCESVYIEDVVGDLDDLIGCPLKVAEESTSGCPPEDLSKPDCQNDSQTWTFYKFATTNGYVTIRWFGSSNGYYSERVSLIKI